MVGVQATNNVLQGERYKSIGKEAVAYCKGEYGTPPAPIADFLLKKALGDDKPLTARFAETLPPIFESTKEQLKGIAKNDEDVLSYISFPAVAEKFFASRKASEERKTKYTIEVID
jgi:oxaloacetate decarboxylase (Na+ extruding) subunit alpha